MTYTPTKISINHRKIMERQRNLLARCSCGAIPMLFDLTENGVEQYQVQCQCGIYHGVYHLARAAVREWNKTH